MKLVIPESELKFSFSRSSGPGGQNVNKVETKVTVAFDFECSAVLSGSQKERLRHHGLLQGNRNAAGHLVVSVQEHRSQARNREEAVRRLHELLERALQRKRRRIPTTKTKASNRRRLEQKKRHSDTKRNRRSVE